MEARAILDRLRRGEPLSPEETGWFGRALGGEEVSDAQAGAFAMGICRAPLPGEARVALTEAMRDSGKVLEWDLPGPVVDKHSTGGVGDCTSLVLAPALAACGVYVPMISGRGLGHTGGTLDKLEAIPGYRAEVGSDRFASVVREAGCAIVAAGDGLAPADKRLYAVRDVTGTVASLDLIVASILSKKLAAGLDALILDVKVGNGAFMEGRSEAEALADALVKTACGAGCPTAALVTDMSQPLVTAAGNALEIAEVMETLTQSGVTHALWEVSARLGGALLALCGAAPDAEAGAAQISDAIASGEAAERLGHMVALLGGPSDFVECWRDRLPAAPVQRVVQAPREGFVAAVDTRALGDIVVALGGGRRQETDRINPAVGLAEIAGIGEELGDGRPLAMIHASDAASADRAEIAIRAAFQIGDAALDPPELILGRVG